MKAVANIAYGFMIMISGATVWLVNLINHPGQAADITTFIGIAAGVIGMIVVVWSCTTLKEAADNLPAKN
jgi:branched-subunit amino acid ABC-type transport system permease component